jgi:hypothetical protein
MFGPYVHSLNKGGLEDIVQSKRLLSTEGRYGDEGVRALRGSFRELYVRNNWGLRPDASRIYVEFATVHAPNRGGPPGISAIVHWSMPAGHYLAIRITGIFDGFGEKVVVGGVEIPATP